MIKFKAKDSAVVVEIEHGIWNDDGGFFSASIETNLPYQAELLRKQFQEKLDKELAKVKEKYYNEGWKEAKAKTKKRKEFYGTWKF